jgi:magnesium transporter
MLKELLKPEIKELIENHSWNDLRDVLESWPAPEIADLLLDTDKYTRVLIFRALQRELSAEVFSYLEHDQRDSLLRDLTDQEMKELLAEMSPDDRTSLLEELPAKATRRLLNLLSPGDLKEARELLGYPEESIGRLMTPDFVAVRPEWTISQALSHIRVFGKDSETINRIYVTDKSGNLLDDVLLRYIILADEEDTVSSLLDHTIVSVSAFDDQEMAVRMMERYDISAIPVVDSEGKLLGIVTFDDIMDVSAEEATEDFQKLSGINPVDQSYQNATVLKLWWKRIPWLIVLLLANSITTGVLSIYSSALESVIALTFFIPMILGTGGNTGTQSSTLIIRSLSVGDIEIKDWLKVFFKEMTVGLLLGAILGITAFLRGMWESNGDITIPLVISFSMVTTVIWANIVGAMLPLLLAKFKLDPAVISSPLISTFTDITGMLIYFNVAIRLLNM